MDRFVVEVEGVGRCGDREAGGRRAVDAGGF